MEIQDGKVVDHIRRIVGEKILNTGRPGEVDDGVIAGLDSIGRLTLLVELENLFDIELMGPDLDPQVFSSLRTLSGYVVRKSESSQGNEKQN